MFYINKYKIIVLERPKNEKNDEFPVGTCFTIVSIGSIGFQLSPLKKPSFDSYYLEYSPSMLEAAFTAVDYIPEQPIQAEK